MLFCTRRFAHWCFCSLVTAAKKKSMPSNVEIKAYVKDLPRLQEVAAKLCDAESAVLIQEDVFFNVPQGRLKLRKIKGQPEAQLVYYNRPDQTGPKFSEYNITLVSDPGNLQETLSKALGIKGIVKKTRNLYMVGQTRVHVDQVDDLGNFMELEVVMKEGQTVEEGQQVAEDLMKKLSIDSKDLISGAYMDLILNKTNGH